MTNVTVANWLR